MAFAAVVDTVFDDPNMAADAIYTPAGGPGVPVRVLLSQPDAEVSLYGASVVVPTTLIQARVSEVPKPAQGDRFTVDDAVYEVNAKPVRDGTRLVWRIEAVEA